MKRSTDSFGYGGEKRASTFRDCDLTCGRAATSRIIQSQLGVLLVVLSLSACKPSAPERHLASLADVSKAEVWRWQGYEESATVFDGLDSYRKQQPAKRKCIEAEEAEKRPAHDEFEKRDRETAIEGAVSSCFSRLRSQVHPFAPMHVYGIPVTWSEYDFNDGSFSLKYPHMTEKVGWGSSSYGGDAIDVQVFSATKGHSGRTLLVRNRYSQALSLTLVAPDNFRSDSLRVPVPVEQARKLKPFLKGGNTRLEVAFALEDYGPTPIALNAGMWGTSNIHGMRGKLIGFRIMLDNEELAPWTPFGEQQGRPNPVPPLAIPKGSAPASLMVSAVRPSAIERPSVCDGLARIVRERCEANFDAESECPFVPLPGQSVDALRQWGTALCRTFGERVRAKCATGTIEAHYPDCDTFGPLMSKMMTPACDEMMGSPTGAEFRREDRAALCFMLLCAETGAYKEPTSMAERTRCHSWLGACMISNEATAACKARSGG